MDERRSSASELSWAAEAAAAREPEAYWRLTSLTDVMAATT